MLLSLTRRLPAGWRRPVLAVLPLLLAAGCALPRSGPAPVEQPTVSVPREEPVPIVQAPADRPQRPSPVLGSAFPLRVAIGLCEDYPEESRSLDAARRDLERARAAGASVLRVAFGWDAIEAQPDQYDWSFWDEFVPLASESYGIRLIPYVCYTPAWAASESGEDFWRSPPRDPEDFAAFMRVVSLRYARWINTWEVWNEPDNNAYWTGTAEEFAELVRAGSRGIRAGNPHAQVVLGGLAWDLDYLRELLEDHAVAPAIDVVNIHSYFETWHEDPIEELPRYLEEAAVIVHAFGESEPLWMAEVGYSSRGARRPGVTELYRARYRNEHSVEYQAASLARTVLASLGSGRLSLLAWFRINDLPPEQDVIGDDHNRHLGIVDVEGNPKPALEALRWLSTVFEQPFRVAGREMIAVAEDGSRLESRHFAFIDGRRLVAVWLAANPADKRSNHELLDDRRETVAKVTLPRASARLAEIAYAPTRADATDRVSVAATASGGGTTLHVRIAGGEVAMVLLE